MANGPYIIGGSSDTSANYFYALRRDDDGNLFIRRDDIANDNLTAQVFVGDKPEEFDGNFLGIDFDAGRNDDHTLEYPDDQVIYEQWYWDTSLASYFLDSEGYLTISYGQEYKFNGATDNINVNTSLTAPTFTYTLPAGIHYAANVRAILIEAGWNEVDPAVFINNINSEIRSAFADTPALKISGSYPYGLTITNHGLIKGVNGFYTSPSVSGEPGNAVYVDALQVTITNTGTISGGTSFTGTANGYAIVGVTNLDALNNTGTIGSTI